ncbi:hypothetical protein KAX97_02780 [candidate division WOR-3 bacterium]|nr:hypothetical protein [candidate division WOR-3 bacterium]
MNNIMNNIGIQQKFTLGDRKYTATEIIKKRFFKAYKKLDRRFNVNRDDTYEYLVNFSQVESKPIHNWFYFQEGYSPDLVFNILKHLGKTSAKTFILDPFAGSGTTLVTAKHLGMKSFGFEINPFGAFITKIKTQNYSRNEVKQIRTFKLPQFRNLSDVFSKYELKIIRNLFSEKNLIMIELLKKKINRVRNQKVHDLLYMGLLSILETVSYYRKGGNGLKRKRVLDGADTFQEYKYKVAQIYEGLTNAIHGPEPKIVCDSCLNFERYGIKKIDISIFSPPYANCFDPFEVYKIELWIGEFVSSYKELRKKRRNALTSNLNTNLAKTIGNNHRTKILKDILDYLSNQQLWDKRIPRMLDTYFNDMYNVLKKIYQRTRKGGNCVMVVGNSAYGNLAIPTDAILAQIGDKVGFNVQEIIVARRNETSSQQHSKLGDLVEYLRESLIILKK